MQEDRDDNLPGKPAEATSSETLSDIEESEKVSAEKGDSEQGSSPAPSPDGAIDTDRSERNPKDDPGPM